MVCKNSFSSAMSISRKPSNPPATTPGYYNIISPCFVQRGHTYFFAVQNKHKAAVSITVRALASSPSIAPTSPPVAGKICDGRYAHHFIDLPAPPASRNMGSLALFVSKTSGQLDGVYVRHEQCPGTPGSSVHKSLYGHGLGTASVTLPSASEPLLQPGRYYVSVRATAEACGEYTIQSAHTPAA